MALEDILKGIENDTSKRIEELGNRAAEESESMKKKAAADASSKVKAAVRMAESDAKVMELREVSKKRMGLKAEYYKEFNKRISDAKAIVDSSTDEFRKTETYSRLMSTLYSKVLDALGDGCTISVCKDDIALVGRSGSATIAASELKGGVVGESRDGFREVDYSLNNIMRIIDDEFTAAISGIIMKKR